MRPPPHTVIAAAALLLLLLSPAAEAATFTCSATATASCQAVAGYVASNATTLAAVRSLFQVSSLAALLGANNYPLSTPDDEAVAASTTILVPFPCRCSNGTGRSDGKPIYTVKAGDGLDAIASYTFDGFVTYQQIAEASNISDPNAIQVGERVLIPLPCSCDPVGDKATVHLAHVVAGGSSVAGIAAEYGTDEATILQLNNMTNPKSLEAGQILDVPLKVCQSSISNTSLDNDLLVPNNSYALTAHDCVLCRCSSSSSLLDCSSIQNKSAPTCPSTTCSGNLRLGNTSTSGCNVTSCTYNGYTNSTGLKILTSLTTNQTACSTGGSTSTVLPRSTWWASLISLHMILIWVSFL